MSDNKYIEERKAFYRELHDGAAQSIAALYWRTQLLKRHIGDKSINLSDIDEIEELARKAQYEIRQHLELLRDYTGQGNFISEVREFCEKFQSTTGIYVSFKTDQDNYNIEGFTELQLKYMIQEALNNLKMHSEAIYTSISFQILDAALLIQIADDGKGFNSNELMQNLAKYEGQGLKKLQQRCKSIGANFQILSSPGQGTTIEIKIPYK